MNPEHVEAPTSKQTYSYETARPAVAADVALFTFREDALQVLLVQRGWPPFAGAWALPGGFVEMDEDLNAAALRELAEETGITDVTAEQLHSFGAPDRDPRTRVITVAHLALLSADRVERSRWQGKSDAAEVTWWDVADLPELAFDHAQIMECAVTRLRQKLDDLAVGLQLLPAAFTLSEVQKLYEVVLDRRLDKRNFRRKILAGGYLEETGRTASGGGRMAKLYHAAKPL